MTVITTDTRVYSVVLDRTIERLAVVTAVIVDAITDAPPRGRVTASVDHRQAAARTGASGTLAVSGHIERLFPELDTTPYQVQLTLRARRYRTLQQAITIPAGTTFPIDAGRIAMTPLPVRLEGRVTDAKNRAAVAGATLAAKAEDKVLLLRMPVHQSHATGATVTLRTLTAGAARTLTAPLPAGARIAILDDVTGLAAGDVLRFGEREYAVIDAVDAASNSVTLAHSLHRTYFAASSVAPVTLGAAGASTTLRSGVEAGESLLSLQDALEASSVEIGGATPEYHDAGLLSDAEGFFAADGVGGTRALKLITTPPVLDPPLEPLETAVTIDYDKDVNPVSVRLKRSLSG